MNKILLILQREYISRVKKRSFLLTTFLVPLLFIGMYAIMFYMMLNNTSSMVTLRVQDESGLVLPELKSTKQYTVVPASREIDEEKSTVAQSEGNELFLYIPEDILEREQAELYDSGSKGVSTVSAIERSINEILRNHKLTAMGIDPKELDQAKTAVNLQTKELTVTGEKDSSIGASIGISFTLAILIYISLFLYGSQVMRGIIEEKSNRIVEVIISSVKPFQLMMGKIIGIGLVGLTQFVLWIVFTGILFMAGTTLMSPTAEKSAGGAAQQEQLMELQQDSKIHQITEQVKAINYPYILGCFLFYFVGGYLLYSALFASVGAAVDNETETQQFTFPVIMPLLFTYMLSFSVLVNDPNGTLAFWLSMIPLTSPIAMLVRVAFGVPEWQLLLSAVLLIIGFVVTTYFAARIYRVGILMYGKKASFKEMIRWLRYS